MLAYLGPAAPSRGPPDDFAIDQLIEMANLHEEKTGIPGTIFVSTAVDAHGPRVKWYPGAPGRKLPCLIVSIEADPQVRDDFVRKQRVTGPIVPRLQSWVAENHAALLDFWRHGETWDYKRVFAFVENLRRPPD